MSFRQFGGLKYASKHNIISSNLNSANQLFITQNIGQPNSTIEYLSDISGNMTLYGNLDVSGNSHISGNLDVSGNENVSGNLDVLGNVDISGNVDVSGNLTAYYMYLSSGTDYSTDNNAVMPKSYIDLAAAGINIVGKVYATSTTNISLNVYDPSLYLDGIPIPTGSNVLLTGQNDQSYNGVYLYTSSNQSNFSRSTTILPTGNDAVGALVIVTNGNLYQKSGWLQTYTNPSTGMATVGTDPLDFTEFYSFNFKIGNGLVSTTNQTSGITYISVDPSLNYMYAIDGSNNALSLGTRSTTTGLNFGSQTNQIPVSFNGAVSPLPITITPNYSSVQIIFTWTIPTLYQNIASSLQQVNAVLYANISGTIQTYPILTNNTSNVASFNKLIISKTPTSNGFLNGSTTTYTYYSSDFANLTSSNSNNVLLLWYSNYGPYPNVSNVSYLGFSVAQPPSSDATFTYNSTSTTSTSTPNSQLTLTYNPPSELVISGSATGVTLLNFTTSLATLGSTIMYTNTLVSQSTTTTLNYTVAYPASQSGNIYGNGSVTNTTLFPDCSYNFTNLTSTNSNPSTSQANSTTFGPYYTAPLQINQSLNQSLNLTPTSQNVSIYNNNNLIYTAAISGNIYKVSDTQATILLSNVYNNQDISSNQLGPFSINYDQNSRGKLGQGLNLMNIYISVPGGGLSQTDISCNGFPTSSNPQISAQHITLSSSINATDQYYGIKGFTGYYLYIPAFTATIPYSLDASSNPYTFTIQQNYLPFGSSSGATYTATQLFYYDNLGTLGNPSITNFALNSSGFTTPVSGINIVGNGTINFSITSSIANLAHYFYYSPPLTYTFGGGLNPGTASETNLSNGNNPSGNNWTITNTSVNATVNTNATSLTTTSSVSVTAKSIQNTNGLSDASNNYTIIYDVPSYNLLNNTSKTPTSIQTVTTLNSSSPPPGYRIWSAPDSTTVTSSTLTISGGSTITTNVTIPPYYSSQGTSSSDYSYSSYPYSQSWSIVDTSTNVTSPTYPTTPATINTSYEIQVYNGHYGTGSSGDLTGTNGYIDYSGSGYYNNTLNYYNVSRNSTDYRYATFVWQLTPGTGQTTINTYNFTFYNMQIDGNQITITNIKGGSPPFYFSNSSPQTRFFLFYRTEEINSGSPVTTPTYSTSSTSIWIDGNNTYGTSTSTGPTLDSSITQMLGSNYFTPTDNSVVRPASAITANITSSVSSSNFTMSVSAIPFNYINSNSYVYCRFGLPMDANVTYDYVTLSVS